MASARSCAENQKGEYVGAVGGRHHSSTGWQTAEIQDVARAAEEAGFEANFFTEVNNDFGGDGAVDGPRDTTYQSRHLGRRYLPARSLLCAKSAIIAADATGGRFILGLGVSHQPVNRALGIDMPDPMGALRKYALEVPGWLRGEGPATTCRSSPLLTRCRSISRR